MGFWQAGRKSKGRIFAVGDIHGCYLELQVLLNELRLTKEDTLILLGDYIDRGSDSKAVLDTIIELKEFCNVVALLGNHEAMMRDSFLEADKNLRDKHIARWYKNGGIATLDSYMFDHTALWESSSISDLFLPISLENHLKLIQDMPTHHITDTHIFVHATPRPDQEIEEQTEKNLLWRRHGKVDKELDYVHQSGKTIISGHTAQEDGIPLILSRSNIIIDSGCVWTGWLTAYNVNTGNYIQASANEVRLLKSDNH